MKKLILFLLFCLVGAILFVLVVKTIGFKEIKDVFLQFNFWQGVFIFLLALISVLIENLKWQGILKAEGVVLPFKKLWRIHWASFTIRYFAPVALISGEMFRGYALNKSYSIPWAKSVSSVVIDRILSWTTNLSIVFVGLIFFLLRVGFPPKSLFVVLAIVLGALGTSIVFFYFKSFRKQSIAKTFFRLVPNSLRNAGFKNSSSKIFEIEKEVLQFFKPDNLAMWKGITLSFLRALMALIRVWCLVFFLGKSISFLSALSLLSFSFLVTLIPIPAQIGSHEAVQAFAFNSLGLGAAGGAAFTMIIRAVDGVLALGGLFMLVWLGWTFLKGVLLKRAAKISQEIKEL